MKKNTEDTVINKNEARDDCGTFKHREYYCTSYLLLRKGAMCSRTLLGPAIRPHYLLHVVLHGKGEFFYQEKKYELSAGDAFLIEPMQTHYYQADKEDPWEYAWVGFDGSCVEEVLSSTIFQSSPVFTTDSALCIQPMIRLNALFFAPEKNPLGLASAFLRLLSCMTRLDTSGRNDHNEQYYQQALEYISNNYSYNLKIQDIADYIGVDRTYLYKIFMREAQISPKQYLLQYRIRAAAKLLQTQNYNVTEIAYSCGFRDSAAFCYHFRQQIGMTPRQYREKIRSGTY